MRNIWYESAASTTPTVHYQYVYDGKGNIVRSIDITKNGKAYTYGDTVWKDRLTAYDGQAITYDAQGNPTSYLGHIGV